MSLNSVEPPTNLRIVFTGGASGGHFYPLVALFLEARKRWPHLQALFIGSRRGLEHRLAHRYAWKVALLPITPFRGRNPLKKGLTVVRLMYAALQARHLLRQFEPSLIVASGSYASTPTGLAARWLGMPLLLHEQNVHPGSAIRWMMKWARGIALTYPPDIPPPIPYIVSGNPVRPEFFNLPDTRPPWPPFRLLILGGSQGSRFLNENVPPILHQIHTRGMELEVIHQAGFRDVEKVRALYEHLGIRATVTDFIEPVSSAFARVHLVISRAGSSTLAEIAAARMASILVPLEGLAGNHQLMNARFFAQKKAAFIHRQDEPGEHLMYLITRLIRQPEAWHQLRTQAGKLAKPDAAERFWSWAESLVPFSKMTD